MRSRRLGARRNLRPDASPVTLRQADLDALSAGIEVVVEVLDDRAGSGVDAAALGACGATAFLMQVRLTNGAGIPLPASGWELHLPSTRRLLLVTGPFEANPRHRRSLRRAAAGWSRDLLSESRWSSCSSARARC